MGAAVDQRNHMLHGHVQRTVPLWANWLVEHHPAAPGAMDAVTLNQRVYHHPAFLGTYSAAQPPPSLLAGQPPLAPFNLLDCLHNPQVKHTESGSGEHFVSLHSILITGNLVPCRGNWHQV